MQKNTISKFYLLVICLTISCCSHTRVVKVRHGKGGVVAVHQGLFGNARSDAKEIMAANCRKGFRITEEGEAVVGSTSDTHEGKKGSGLFGGKLVTTSKTDKTEWRLKYKCMGKKSKKRKIR